MPSNSPHAGQVYAIERFYAVPDDAYAAAVRTPPPGAVAGLRALPAADGWTAGAPR
ncbi:hypothetical protein [Streptomyces sp. NPDC005181]|uniref:hypothetical protein n=1 Tax=Streptomyces sp. NPDC005181 TaxID=3156869 RepID=UPI0033A62D78